MNSYLRKALFFNAQHPKYAFIFSVLCFLGSLFFVKEVLANKQKLEELTSSYLNEFMLSKNLQKAARLIHKEGPNSIIFIKEELEKVHLLSHITHRHEQASNPSLPLNFNPKDNRLVHDEKLISDKGFKKHRFELVKNALVDEEDLKQIFSLIEHKTIFPFKIPDKAPYFYFTKFFIKKQALSSCENLFEISYQLEGVNL
jgi:hypothetical protein